MEDKNFEKAKILAESDYKNIGKVRCPYFNESIAFNTKGFEYLNFKSKIKARERKDAYIRLKNIKFAPQIIKQSHTLQEIHSKKVFVRVKTKTKKEYILKNCDYYAFVSIINDGNFQKRLKIIVKQIEGGEKHFWSIIPFWKSNKEIKLHSGNLEND